MTTPQTKQSTLAKTLGLTVPLYFKREDLHPFGSHKGRSIPLMIDQYVKQGQTNFVISSSGNAALAAAMYIKKYNEDHGSSLTLKIFVGEKIDKNKLDILNKFLTKQITIIITKNPKQQAFQIDRNGQAKILRQSTDELALLGYEQLAKELSNIKKLSAVFIPSSSGTTAEGLYLGFKKLKLKPQIHIVQTSACHPMAATFSPTNLTTTSSIAGAIVDNIAHRKESVVTAIEKTKGFGWIANDTQIQEAIDLVYETEKIKLSPNSALAVAGLQKAIENNYKFKGPIVCLITGK